MRKSFILAILLLFATISFAQILPPINATLNTTEPVNYTQVQNACSIALQDFFGASKSASISVHGTEYQRNSDTSAKIFIQVIQGNITLDNLSCTTTSFYPNNSVYFENEIMTFIQKGLYVFDSPIATNQQLGVYPTLVDCLFPSQIIAASANNFSNIQGTITGSINNTFIQDGTFQRDQETNIVERHFDIIYNFSVANLTINTTRLQVATYSSWSGGGAGETVNIFIYNFTGNNWLQLPNSIPDVNNFISVTNSISSSILNFTNGTSGQVMVRFNDSAALVDGANSNFDLDYLAIILDNNVPTPIEHLQGSGEMHISSGIEVINNSLTSNYFLLQTINTTSTANNLILQTINSTVTNIYANSIAQIIVEQMIFDKVFDINVTVTSINNYLNGFITTVLSNINSTVTSINAKNFTAIINTTNTTVVVNTTNTTVVINTTNTTVVVNTTVINANITLNATINATVNVTDFLNQLLDVEITQTPL